MLNHGIILSHDQIRLLIRNYLLEDKNYSLELVNYSSEIELDCSTENESEIRT